MDSGAPTPSGSRRSRRSQGAEAASPSVAPLPSESAQVTASGALPTVPEDGQVVHGPRAQIGSVDGNPSNLNSQQQYSNFQSASAGRQRRMSSIVTPGSKARFLRGDLARPSPRPQGLPVPMAVLDGDVAPTGDADEAPDNTYIWGTRISAASISRAAKRFLTTFKDAAQTEESIPKYVTLVIQAVSTGENVVNIDTADMRSVDAYLYKRMVEYPREVAPLFDEAVRDVAREKSPDKFSPDQLYTARMFNLEVNRTIRDLNPEDIDMLVSVQGMVTRTSPIIPDLKVAHFKCQRCGHGHDVANEDGRVTEPEKCDGCGAKHTSVLIHNLCGFVNKQMVKMQEKPNDIPEGETPHSVALYVFETNVDMCRPGDRVTVTGVYRAAPIRVNPRQRVLHAGFRTFIDVTHVQRNEAGRMFSLAAQQEKEDAEKAAAQEEPGGPSQSGAVGVSGITGAPSTTKAGSQTTKNPGDAFFQEDNMQSVQLGATSHEQVREREARIKELSKDPKLYERLVASLAPNIWGMEDVKQGLLCQLFGGLGKSFPGGRVRGEINCLMVGDPSVSKSQLLTYMHALAPRGMYCSGKGSSATGLTAYVTRDPETNELVLESGALVMSDRGICCIDEFDKMSDSARAMLHETMEQQTVSVAKAGLISTLNARTSVCACANPIGSRYNPNLTVSENINLPPTLLTRFDLIYLLLDKFEEAKDLRLARHLISLYHEGAEGANMQRNNAVELISQDALREYIAYARARVQPKITTAAADELQRTYCSLRQDGRRKKVIVATPRQLESLIRLSEAQARMYLSDVVTKAHVEEATRLWFQAMSQASPGEDGGIDQDTMTTGLTAANRRSAKNLPAELEKIMNSNPNQVVSVTELLEGLAPLGVTKEALLAQLRQLSHVLSLDERTGVVRSRRALAPIVPGATAAGTTEVATGPAPMDVA